MGGIPAPPGDLQERGAGAVGVFEGGLGADGVTILRYVFGYTGASTPPADELNAFPRRTALERAVVDYLTTGRHWRGGAGWLLL